MEGIVDTNSLKKFCDVTTNFYYSNPDNFDKLVEGGNETRPSIKEGKYKVFTFADRHPGRVKNMFLFKKRLEQYDILDEVKVFNLSHVDSEYIENHKELFDSKIFPWISKAYLINKHLEECDDGDIIFWIDSDIVDLEEDSIETVFNMCNNSEKGIVGFHNDFWLERLFTKSDVLNHLNVNTDRYLNTNQSYGGIFLVKKSDYTVDFFKQWFEICSIIPLMDNSESISPENPHFITHKNDQSILSLLYKINNIKTFPLPLYDCDKSNVIAIHSGYFNAGIELPIVWESCWHGVSIEEMWRSCNAKFGRKVSPDQCLSISTNYRYD